MASVLINLAGSGSVVVNEIAGGSHSPNSAHYDGIAIDIGQYNGRRLERGYAGATVVTNACSAGGASRIFNINLGCGKTCTDHSSWAHCRW